MSIIIDQWHWSIGLFYGQVYEHFSIKPSRGCCDFKIVGFISCFFTVFTFLLLLKHRVVEITPGAKKKETIFFSCLHCNVNITIAHDKLSFLETYNTIHRYDILCISDTYLDSSVSIDDTTLSHPGCNLVRSDDPSNISRGGVCLHYKEKLSLRCLLPFSVHLMWSKYSKTERSWLLFIDLQAKQHLNSYHILRSFFILLNNFNHPLL